VGEHVRDVGEHAVKPRRINSGYRCRGCGGAIRLDESTVASLDGYGTGDVDVIAMWVHVERAPKDERDRGWERRPESFGRMMRRVGREAGRAAATALASTQAADE
jgi:hypothetical protein